MVRRRTVRIPGEGRGRPRFQRRARNNFRTRSRESRRGRPSRRAGAGREPAAKSGRTGWRSRAFAAILLAAPAFFPPSRPSPGGHNRQRYPVRRNALAACPPNAASPLPAVFSLPCSPSCARPARQKVVTATVAQLYVAYPDASRWTYANATGAAVLVKDGPRKAHLLQVVDILVRGRDLFGDGDSSAEPHLWSRRAVRRSAVVAPWGPIPRRATAVSSGSKSFTKASRTPKTGLFSTPFWPTCAISLVSRDRRESRKFKSLTAFRALAMTGLRRCVLVRGRL
ncbi:MAG: hypothetical protein BJ554DRAFT_3032 [Olpidium bornovanus]|uniref:WH1 domain-containing protein n=1 Tax=Olpidium bornovanus TaxID=278681 RepID=A0A8H7ZPW4_9FUNG|nr:MAG: hypothetical protein BJ554DRAFT_3032 [Olpidium bornovanus]